MKKAIVLLMTIGFIALISALVLVSLSISKRSFDEVVYLQARNQFSVVFKDFIMILNNNTAKIKKVEELNYFLDEVPDIPPILAEPKTGVTIGFEKMSQMGKLNVNYLLDQIRLDVNGTKIEDLERPFHNYFSRFSLKSPRLLLDIFVDTIDKDDMERGAYSEIASEDYDFREGKIYSYNHVKKIFDHYYKVSNDSSIYKIERELWEEVFYFGDTNKSKQFLDCEQSEFSTMNLITQDELIESENFCELFTNSEDQYLKKLKDIYNISDFNKTNQYLIQCTITFNTENFNRNVRFDYDIKTGKVGNIDKNFQE